MLRVPALCASPLIVAASIAGWQPAAAQMQIHAQGSYLHQSSEAVFPVRVGAFERDSLYQFDPEGRNVGVSYNLMRPEGRLLLTIYVYPAPDAASAGGSTEAQAAARAWYCERQFRETKQAIANGRSRPRPVEQGPALAVAGVEASLSHRSIYRYRTRFDDREQDVRSEAHLYCFVKGKWLVKYRVTTPANVDGRGAIDAFIRAGPWPGRTPIESTVQRDALPAGG